MEHQRITILSVLLLIAVVAGLSDSPAHAQETDSCGWKQMGNTTSTFEMSLRAGAVESSNGMWAVGDRNDPTVDGDGSAAIRAWDGSGWQDESSTNLLWSQLNDVDVAPDALPIAVGSYTKQGRVGERGQQWSRALALHRKPDPLVATLSDTQWEASRVPRSDLEHDWLTGVTAVNGEQAWAVGQAHGPRPLTQVLIYNWNGTAWKRSRPRLDGLLWDVEASAPDNVWAVGTAPNREGVGNTLSFHFNGNKWRRVPTPNHNRLRFHTLLGVGVRSNKDAWAVGYRHGRGTAIIPIALHWNGTRWRLADNLPRTSRRDGAILYDVVPLEGEVVAVGWNGSFSNPRPLLWSKTSEGWTWTEAPEGGVGTMEDIKAGRDGSLLSVGDGTIMGEYREYILFRPPC